MRMVKRRNEGHPLLGRQLPGHGHRIFAVTVVMHHVSAIAPGGGQLGRRGIVRHDERGRHAQHARRQGNGLRMVAGRIGHHTGTLLLWGELCQGIECTAKLESAHALEVFALEKNLCPQLLVQGCTAQHGCAVRLAVQALGSSAHVLKCGQSKRCHALSHPFFNAK